MPYDNIISRTDAQATMPEEVSNKFLEGLTNNSAVLSTFTRVPVGRKQVRFPVLSALPIAYFLSGDTGLKQTTEINWDNKYLNIEEIAAIIPVPESVIDDSAMPIWSQCMPLLEQAAGRTLDAATFFGVNAPGTFPTAVVTAAAAAGNTIQIGTNNAAAGGIIGDQSDLLALIEADGYDPSNAVSNRVVRGLYRQARSTQGERLNEITITKDSVEADGVTHTFPMRGQWPTAGGSARSIMFDPAEFVVGVRQDITFKVLDQAVIQDNQGAIVYNLAQQDMVALRLVLRVGWQVANTINYDQPDGAARYPAGILHIA